MGPNEGPGAPGVPGALKRTLGGSRGGVRLGGKGGGVPGRVGGVPGSAGAWALEDGRRGGSEQQGRAEGGKESVGMHGGVELKQVFGAASKTTGFL